MHRAIHSPRSHRRIIFRMPKTKADVPMVARAILEKFASRAYRRPVTAAELDKLVKLIDLAIQNGDRFDRGIQLAVQAILVSPEFLFRVELDSRGRKIAGKGNTLAGGQWIGDFELASRMSYFLWSSMPDDELWRVTVDGSLRSPEVLEKAGPPHAPRSQGAGARRQLRRPVASASQPEVGQSRSRHLSRNLTKRSARR